MKFLNYQRKFIEDKSRLKILVKGRQIGGTFAVSYSVWKRLMETRNHNIIVCTRDERLAKEFIGNVKKWIMLWNFKQTDPKLIVPESCMKQLEIEIPHAEGSTRLIAVSSNPNAIIGKTGDLILDEFAVSQHPDLLWSLAQPVINMGGCCTILSTQRGRNTLFNKILEDAENDPNTEWSVHKTTIEEAVEDGLVDQIINPRLLKLGGKPFKDGKDFIKWLKKIVDEHTFAQEYMCIASSEATDLLTREEVKNAVNIYKERGSLPQGTCYLGYDVAESDLGDFAAICILRVLEGDVEVIHSHYFPKGTKIDDQLDEVKRLSKLYKVYKIVMDSNGIGRYPTTVLQKRLGEINVIGFVSTMNSKAEMYQKVKRFFQNGRVRMPEDDAIEQDFLSICRIITPSNNIIYQASRTGGSHGDMSSAFSMALTEVPEKLNVTIEGHTSKPTCRVEPPPSEETIHDRILRNRKLDAKAKKSFTY